MLLGVVLGVALRVDSMKNPAFWLEADLRSPLAHEGDEVFDDVQTKLCDESKEST